MFLKEDGREREERRRGSRRKEKGTRRERRRRKKGAINTIHKGLSHHERGAKSLFIPHGLLLKLPF